MIDLHDFAHPAPRQMAVVVAVIAWMGWGALRVYSEAGSHASLLSRSGMPVEERVAYQRAIEEVYWRHRIWPKENSHPRPALDEVMFRAKVADYLSKSQALAVYWQRPITGEQLQAEMDRMARETMQPGMLAELWTALGNDPYVIAECLARPSLANRLIRNRYAYDERYHGGLRARAEAELRAHGSAGPMRNLSGEYQEVEWTKGERAAVEAKGATPRSGQGALALSSNEWEEGIRRLAQQFKVGPIDELPLSRQITTRVADRGTEVDRVPTGELSPLQEDEERFYVTAVLGKADQYVKVATVAWKKEPFDSWWKGGGQLGAPRTLPVQDPSYEYRLTAIGSKPDGSADDASAAVLAPAVSAQWFHTAVWTDREMIVWGGGRGFSTFLNTGGRYDPATDTWVKTTTTNAPNAREGHTAVWTGSEMIVWGGFPFTSSGGRYDPATDTWTPTSTTNAPSGRAGHTAVWTGTEMIVWGGIVSCNESACHSTNTGGRYDPATDTWAETSMADAPGVVTGHTAVWTGSEMIVWSGEYYDDSDGQYHLLASGGRYEPATDTWAEMAMNNAPSARVNHTAVWTGSEMVAWGGTRDGTGGLYDPATDTWAAMAMASAPSPREVHTAVWTGSEMIVWGGAATTDATYLNTGGRYDPATDTWTATSTTNAPSERFQHTAVWTGSEMIVWGGVAAGPTYLNTGGRYDPATDTWAPTATTNAPSARSNQTAEWAGSEMLVWGGYSELVGVSDTGGRYCASRSNSAVLRPFQ